MGKRNITKTKNLTNAASAVFKIILSVLMLTVASVAFAQITSSPTPPQNIAQTIHDIRNKITTEINYNNTAFFYKDLQPKLFHLKPKVSPAAYDKLINYDLFKPNAYTISFLKYKKNTGQDEYIDTLGLYPSVNNINAADLSADIINLTEIAPNIKTLLLLNQVIRSPYIHEFTHIESLLAASKISRQKILLGVSAQERAFIQNNLYKELEFLESYRHELIANSGKKFDAALRSKIRTEMKALTGKETASHLIMPENMALTNKYLDNTIMVANIALITYGATAVFKGITTGVLGYLNLPSAKLTPIKPNIIYSGKKTTMNLNPSFKTVNINTKTAISPAFTAQYFNGTSALKTAPVYMRIATNKLNVKPMIAPKTQPQNNASFAAVAILPYAQNLNKEQIKYLIRTKQETPDLKYLAPNDRDEIDAFAISLGKTISGKIPMAKSLEKENNFKSAPLDNAYMDNLVNLLTEYEQKILDNYSLTEEYINGYYAKRIYPYLANPQYPATDTGVLYRGRLLTIAQLKSNIKKGMNVNLTRWHTGSKNNAPVISTSLSESEAKSYIFQSGFKKNAIGVVFKIKKTDAHELLMDNESNKTKTIYHSYESLSPQDIIDVYILGPYGLENISNVIKKINNNEIEHSWVNAFDRLVR